MSLDEKKISAVLIIEVLGRPPEHLVETLENISKKIGEEKGIKVTSNKINPPVLIKDQTEFYASFAEIEVEVEEILSLAILMFKYMPANIEIISPQNISLPNSGWNDILNELTRRLHGYEELARMMQTEKIILENKLRGLIGSEKKEEVKEKRVSKNKK